METDALKEELTDEEVYAKYAHTTRHGAIENMKKRLSFKIIS